jgi:hypothetical protein
MFFHRLHMEQEFTQDDYRTWLRGKIATDNFLNREIICFGPDTLFLYYLRRRAFNISEHVVVESVSSVHEEQAFYNKIINETTTD